MPERILKLPEPPPVLVCDSARLRRTRRDRRAEQRLGVPENQQHPPCRSSDRVGAEPVQTL